MKHKYDGNQIKQMREQLGLSQSQFAALINANTSTIQMWEQGVSKPTTYTLFLLQEYVNAILVKKHFNEEVM